MRCGVLRTKSHDTSNIINEPIKKPSKGERKIKNSVLISPLEIKDVVPAFANAAPIRPPMSAWDDEEGMPKYHVKKFHVMAANKAPNTT